MYQNEYIKVVEMIEIGTKFLKDLNNICRCKNNLNDFNRLSAWFCLQDMIKEYTLQISFLGLFPGGPKIMRNVKLDDVSDSEMFRQLTYICINIPIYILVREGNKELAKRIYFWSCEKY